MNIKVEVEVEPLLLNPNRPTRCAGTLNVPARGHADGALHRNIKQYVSKRVHSRLLYYPGIAPGG